MKDFLAQFKSWAHWVAGVIIVGAAAYVVPGSPIHNSINTLVGNNPRITGVVGSLALLITLYANSKKT